MSGDVACQEYFLFDAQFWEFGKLNEVRNTDVLTRIGKELKMLYEIKCRKLEYFSHVIRNEKYRL